jgi:MOSC domain-containing protein YiiM
LNATVFAVASRKIHRLSKVPQMSTRLVAGQGVDGDAHKGVTVKHRSRVSRDPTAPNLRQVHLIQSELFDELAAKGFNVRAGELGENVATFGIDVLGLSAGTQLRLGTEAVIEITGLRNPCVQLNCHSPGLMNALIYHDAGGALVRKCGVMAIVLTSGDVWPGDPVTILHAPETHIALTPV